MNTNPVESILRTAMNSLRDMIDVNTIVGNPVSTQDGSVIIPVSRVSFGYVSGGGEYGQQEQKSETPAEKPFAGGAGGGVSVSPVAFLVVSGGEVQLLPVQYNTVYERLLERIPSVIEEVRLAFADPAPTATPTGGGGAL